MKYWNKKVNCKDSSKIIFKNSGNLDKQKITSWIKKSKDTHSYKNSIIKPIVS